MGLTRSCTGEDRNRTEDRNGGKKGEWGHGRHGGGGGEREKWERIRERELKRRKLRGRRERGVWKGKQMYRGKTEGWQSSFHWLFRLREVTGDISDSFEFRGIQPLQTRSACGQSRTCLNNELESSKNNHCVCCKWWTDLFFFFYIYNLFIILTLTEQGQDKSESESIYRSEIKVAKSMHRSSLDSCDD